MPPQTTIKKYHQLSARLLKRLVTARGIFASTDNGWRGSFHAWFGRDSAITASLVFSAEKLQNKRRLSKKAYRGLLRLRKWQGEKNQSTTGEEKGKITHEVRTAKSHNKQTLSRLKEYKKLWFLDSKDHLLKSWDSVDSTPLWIMGVARWHDLNQLHYSPDVLDSLRSALQWCLDNLEEYDGLAGFKGADLRPERTTTGLHNQGWKDNFGAYQYPDGSLAEQPIKDVFVNSLFWAALKYGGGVFAERDNTFAAKLEEAAEELKRRFNSPRQGFLMVDAASGLHYFAEALDGKGRQLRAISADAAMCLWAHYQGECIIDELYIGDVVHRIVLPDMLNPEAGIRNYSSSTVVRKLYAGGYHRSPNTYWPFVSGLVVEGLDYFGYKDEAFSVAEAALKGVSHFDSCIEMFLEVEPHKFEHWHDTTDLQESSTDQAWTAAAVYYVTAYLTQRHK